MSTKTRRLTRATNTQLPEWRWPLEHNRSVQLRKGIRRFEKAVVTARRSFQRMTAAAKSAEGAMLQLRDALATAEQQWKDTAL